MWTSGYSFTFVLCVSEGMNNHPMAPKVFWAEWLLPASQLLKLREGIANSLVGFSAGWKSLQGKDLIRKKKPTVSRYFTEVRSWATHKGVSCYKFFSGMECVSLIGVMTNTTPMASHLPRVAASIRNGNMPFLCALKDAQWGGLRSHWGLCREGRVGQAMGQQDWAATCWQALSSLWTDPGDSIKGSAASSRPWLPLTISKEGNESPKSIMTLN